MIGKASGSQRDRRRQMACRMLGLPLSTPYSEATAHALARTRPSQCRRGHDLTNPAAVTLFIGVDADSKNGWSISYKCRTCAREYAQRRRADLKAVRDRRCQQCDCIIDGSQGKQFCSPACRKAFLVTAGKKPHVPDLTNAQADRLLDLQVELERETRAWLRPEIQAKIDAMRQPRK